MISTRSQIQFINDWDSGSATRGNYYYIDSQTLDDQINTDQQIWDVLRICLLNKFPGDADIADLGPKILLQSCCNSGFGQESYLRATKKL